MARYFAWSLLLVIVFSIFIPAVAHQPFFEDKEFTAANPELIKDPTISTAVYATLETPNDVDYYSFEGRRGETIFLSITIPQIAGQENFTPTMALMGQGLPSSNLPDRVEKPKNYGSLILPPPENSTAFFEPFSRTSYWTRQEQNVTLPENSSYQVAIWDDRGEVGRYVFVIGNKEVPGGDLAFPLKMRGYWKPVEPYSKALNEGYPAENKTNFSGRTNISGGQPASTSADRRTQPGFETAYTLIGLMAAAHLIRGRNLLGKN
jgi:hypothetical protein